MPAQSPSCHCYDHLSGPHHLWTAVATVMVICPDLITYGQLFSDIYNLRRSHIVCSSGKRAERDNDDSLIGGNSSSEGLEVKDTENN